MILFILLVSTSVYWTQQHLTYPLNYCNLAAVCIHDNRMVCAATEDGCSRRTFLNHCDMYECNCDFGARYWVIRCGKENISLVPFKYSTNPPPVTDTTESDYLENDSEMNSHNKYLECDKYDKPPCERPTSWFTTVKEETDFIRTEKSHSETKSTTIEIPTIKSPTTTYSSIITAPSSVTGPLTFTLPSINTVPSTDTIPSPDRIPSTNAISSTDTIPSIDTVPSFNTMPSTDTVRFTETEEASEQIDSKNPTDNLTTTSSLSSETTQKTKCATTPEAKITKTRSTQPYPWTTTDKVAYGTGYQPGTVRTHQMRETCNMDHNDEGEKTKFWISLLML